MACQKTNKSCNCDFNIKSFGLCDPKRVTINGEDRTVLNWSEISVPEILCVPEAKPNIENLDQVYATADLTSVKLIETPFAYEVISRLSTQEELNALGVIYNSINVGTNSIITLVGAVTTAVSAVITGIPIADITPAIQALINTVNDAVDLVNSTLATLVTASAEALTLINLGPTGALANSICELLATLESLINSLSDAILALLTAVEALVELVIELVPLLDAVLTPLLATVNSTVKTVLSEIEAVIELILNLIALLGFVRYVVITPNEEGTCLTGRKLVIEGFLNQKVVYTGDVDIQSVHSAHYSVPFSAFIVAYANFDGLDYVSNVTINTLVNGVSTPMTISGFGLSCNGEIPDLVPDLCEEFCVETYIEDVFATALDPRTIFKNVTLFLLAKPSGC